MQTNKLIHFYFDWNIFKYLKNPRNEHDVRFSKFIYSLKDYILIAYSPFHLSGLLKNFDKSKWDYILKDCELITSITNNLCIYYDQNNQIHIEYRDPFEMFIEQLNSESFEALLDIDVLYQNMTNEQREQFETNFYTAKSQLQSNPQSDPFSTIFINSSNPQEAFKNLFVHNKKIKSDPQTYLNLRSALKESINKIHNLPKEDKDKFIKFLQSKGINKDISELNDDDLILISKEFIDQKFDTSISNKYILKDLFGITKPENISHKNTFKNIIDDSFHLEMSKYSIYYITEDKANIEKSKMISEEINSISEIYSIEEANKRIRVSLFTIKQDVTQNQKNST